MNDTINGMRKFSFKKYIIPLMVYDIPLMVHFSKLYKRRRTAGKLTQMDHSCRHCNKIHAFSNCPVILELEKTWGIGKRLMKTKEEKLKKKPQLKIEYFFEVKKKDVGLMSIKQLPKIPLKIQSIKKEGISIGTQTIQMIVSKASQTEVSTTDVVNMNHLDIDKLEALRRPRRELLVITDGIKEGDKEHAYIVGLKNTSRLKSIKTVEDALLFKLTIFIKQTKGASHPSDLDEEAIFVFLHEFAKDRGKGNRSTSIATGTVDRYCNLLKKILKRKFELDVSEVFPLYNTYRSNWKKNIVEEHNYKIVQAPAFDEGEQETFLNEIKRQITLMEGDLSNVNKQKMVYYLKLMKTVLTMVFYTGNRLGEFLNTRLYQVLFYESWESGFSETAVSISLRGGKTDRENNKSGNISIYEDKTATFCPVKALINWLDDNGWKVEQDGSFKTDSKVRLFPDFRDREKSVITSHLVGKINKMEEKAGWAPKFRANTPRSSVAATAVLAKDKNGSQRITQTMLNSNFRWSANSEMPGRYPRDAIPLAKENFAFQIREIKKEKRKECEGRRGKKPKKVNPWPNDTKKEGDTPRSKRKGKDKKIKKQIRKKLIKKQ